MVRGAGETTPAQKLIPTPFFCFNESIMNNEKGFLGLRPILILAIVGGFAVWALYRGYIQWKGPRPAEVAQDVADDVTRSVKKIVN